MTISRFTKIYASFLLLALILQMLLLSLALFFHFQLGHSVAIQEEWLQRNHWALVGFSKIMALAFILKWQATDLDSLPIRNGPFHLEGLALGSIVPLLFFWSRGVFNPMSHWQWDLTLGSYLGCFVYVATDFWLWQSLPSALAITDRPKSMFLYAVIAMATAPLFFPSRPKWNFLIALHFLVLSFFVKRGQGGWWYIALVVAPLAAIWGADYWLIDNPGIFSWGYSLSRIEIAALWIPYLGYLLFFQYRRQHQSLTQKF